MIRVIKWAAIIGGILIALLILILIVAPRFVDIQQYKPRIEERVASATGRPFTLSGDLSLSLFPWAGVSFSDLHLGNPDGFEEKDFVQVKSFEVRVKLLPLLFRDVQIKRFIVDGARIVLEKRKDGRTSWHGLGHPPGAPTERAEPPKEKRAGEFPLKDFTLGELAVTNGVVLWIDHATNQRREISDVTVRLQDVSMRRPISFLVSSLIDKKPVALEGNIGPFGKEPGKGSVPVALSVTALNELAMTIKGSITDPASQPRFDLAMEISSFSPRKFMAALDRPFPLKTKDPAAVNRVSLKAALKGNPEMVTLTDGVLTIDESTLRFSTGVKAFAKPDVTFDATLDRIDVDRYLPPPVTEKPAGETMTKASPPAKKPTDYTPLRKLRVNGSVKIGELTVRNARMQELALTVSGENGVFSLKPVTVKLYEGTVAGEALLNVIREVPRTKVKITSKGIQVNPLLNDILKKDILEGTAVARIELATQGDDASGIKRTLNGKGELIFNDGAIKGFDLAGMVRNVKDAFSSAPSAEKPRTDFSELRVPFTATNGVVNTTETSIKSPFLRVIATGNANLVDETLDFRIVPKVVATVKGQGDTAARSGITVPVRVTGTFSSPRFGPDLEGLLKQGLEGKLPKPKDLEETLKKAEPKGLEKELKGLMKDVLKQ